MKWLEKEEVIRISYRKKGEEKAIFASSKEALETSKIGAFSEGGTLLTINKEVELLHLKRASLLNIKKIECQNKETILKVEECELEPLTIFKKGKVILETSTFDSSKEKYYPYHLLFEENAYVEFILGNKGVYENHIFQLNKVKNIKITGNASKLIIRETNRTENSYLQNVYIQEVTHYVADVLNAKNVVIEESEVDSISLLRYQTLSITNATISSKTSYSVLNLEAGEIKIENSVLEGKVILLPDGTFKPENGSLIYKEKINQPQGSNEVQKNRMIPFSSRTLQIPVQAMYSYYNNLKDTQKAEEYFKRVADVLERDNQKRARIRN